MTDFNFMRFPVFKTKIKGITKKFDLTDVNQRQEYFELKAGPEIKKLRQYLRKNTFIAYLLGKKNSGKGTYAKMFKEVVAPDRIEHFSIGDMVRDFDGVIHNKKKKKEFLEFLQSNYRGYLSLDKIIESLEKRSTKKLLPTELILALVKKEISQRPRKALFIDGFPRDMDQVSYSLFFRDLINYREDPDVFVLIDVPEKVIDERIKYRVICPLCQTSRSRKLLPTKKKVYDRKKKRFDLICDNPACKGAVMVQKEGDEKGVAPIRERIRKDEELIKKVFSLYGLPKILLRNSVPVKSAARYIDDYEITPEFNYRLNEETGEIETIEKPWVVKDDNNVSSYSLMPPPVVVSLIKQMAEVLNL